MKKNTALLMVLLIVFCCGGVNVGAQQWGIISLIDNCTDLSKTYSLNQVYAKDIFDPTGDGYYNAPAEIKSYITYKEYDPANIERGYVIYKTEGDIKNFSFYSQFWMEGHAYTGNEYTVSISKNGADFTALNEAVNNDKIVSSNVNNHWNACYKYEKSLNYNIPTGNEYLKIEFPKMKTQWNDVACLGLVSIDYESDEYKHNFNDDCTTVDKIYAKTESLLFSNLNINDSWLNAHWSADVEKKYIECKNGTESPTAAEVIYKVNGEITDFSFLAYYNKGDIQNTAYNHGSDYTVEISSDGNNFTPILSENIQWHKTNIFEQWYGTVDLYKMNDAYKVPGNISYLKIIMPSVMPTKSAYIGNVNIVYRSNAKMKFSKNVLENGNITAYAAVRNISSNDAISPVIYIAHYKNKTVVDVAMSRFDKIAINQEGLSDVTLNLKNVENGDVVKCFLWNGLMDMKPVLKDLTLIK